MRKKTLLIISLGLFVCLSTQAQNIPFDKSIKTGKLENGLTYYIKQNNWPENRAQFRLVVNAGSVLEDENQKGLAHFCEHMCFNGTKKFHKNELVNYLESIGMKFGPGVNAYTGFDETVYMLGMPTDNPGLIEKGIEILSEWAQNVSFEDEEIDKERGVIIEEWRSGRGASGRLRDVLYPTLFTNSNYAERLPIGEADIIENFKYETLRKFYKDWYRPDLISIVAVGNFEPEFVEGQIAKYFSGMKKPENARERKECLVPDHKNNVVKIFSDKENDYALINLYYLFDPQVCDNEFKYRKELAENLFTKMLNGRLNEIMNQANPPFNLANSSKSRIVRNKPSFNFSCALKTEKINAGIEGLLTEGERVIRHGFTNSELERAKKELMSSVEKSYNEKDKIDSGSLADEIMQYYLRKDPVPGVEYEYNLCKKYIPEITLSEVNSLTTELIRLENMVAFLSLPEKAGEKALTENEVMSIIDNVKKKEVAPYVDNTSDKELFTKNLKPTVVLDEKYDTKHDIYFVKLDNGVKVYLKPTDFKNDEIILSGFSPGGTSLVSDENYIAAETAADLVSLSGVGSFSSIELDKKLSGVNASVSFEIDDLNEGVSGRSSVKDLETMFKMLYLRATDYKIDSSAFLSYQSRLKSSFEYHDADPEAVFSDTIRAILSGYSYREQTWNDELIRQMDINKSLGIYKNRFSDFSDFTFLLVGNFKYEEMKQLLQKYLGNLPSTGRNENWVDIRKNTPVGAIRKIVKKGLEKKSNVKIVYKGLYEWSSQVNFNISSLVDVLRLRLREEIREESGGTYGVGVRAKYEQYPKSNYEIHIGFGCNPERAEELIGKINNVISEIKKTGVKIDNINKIKEQRKRSHEVNLKDNRYWMSVLENYLWNRMDVSDLDNYLEKVEHLSSEEVKISANKYLDENNVLIAILYPENN